MKILHINSYYSASAFYKNLYDEQVKGGLDIDVYVPVLKSFDCSGREFGDYTKVHRVFNQTDRVFFHLKQRKITTYIRSAFDLTKFDLVHAHSLFTNGYAAMKLSLEHRVPYCVAVRNTDLNFFFKRMIHLRKTGIRILENASRVIFLSPAYRDEVIENIIPVQLRKKIRNKSVVIPNGIDLFWIENIGSPKSIVGKKEIRLLHVGEISKNKNIQTTLRAMNQMNKEESSLSYTLTAVGKIKDKKLLAKLKTNDHFRYIEPQKKEELIHIYRDHDIFVMPSIHETFGLVYAEAMSQGLPVIYTRGQGFDGQFEDGEVGYAVEHYSPEQIACNINNVACNYSFLSQNCVEKVCKFLWDRVAKYYEKIYDDILRKVITESENSVH